VDRIEKSGGSLKVELTEDDEAEIKRACQEAEPAGARYPESFASALYDETPSL